MHSDSVFSPPRYYKSFTCPNKVSLLFGLNSKLVPNSRYNFPSIIIDKTKIYFSVIPT